MTIRGSHYIHYAAGRRKLGEKQPLVNEVIGESKRLVSYLQRSNKNYK